MFGRVLGRGARGAASAGRSKAAQPVQQPMARPGMLGGSTRQAALTGPTPAMSAGMQGGMARQMMTSAGPNSARTAVAENLQAGRGAGRAAGGGQDARFVAAVIAASLALMLGSVDEEALAEEQAKAEARFERAGIRMPRGEEDGEAKTALVLHLAKGDPETAQQLQRLDVSELVTMFVLGSALRGVVEEVAGPMAGDLYDQWDRAAKSSEEL